MVSAEQLAAEIDERLTLGQELIDQPVGDFGALTKRKDDYHTWSEYNATLLTASFDSAQPAKEYEGYTGSRSMVDTPLGRRWEWLHRDISNSMRRLHSLQERLPLYRLHPDATVQAAPPPDSSVIGDDIFIVHGHDGETKVKIARFLERLVTNTSVILHEQADRGRTIVEKFEDHAARAACAIVLLTADDTGGPKAGPQGTRARQNVVLELGFFLGKLGRERVVILYEPEVELPSDLNGVIYTPLDQAGAWRMALARELNAIGLAIDSEVLLAP